MLPQREVGCWVWVTRAQGGGEEVRGEPVNRSELGPGEYSLIMWREMVISNVKQKTQSNKSEMKMNAMYYDGQINSSTADFI